MTPEEWQKVRPILESALELDSANRPAFLNEACTDPSLRLEIESLIDAHEQADTRVLNSLPLSGSDVAIEDTDDPMIGRHLGVYELARRIGQGGMAAVFLAYRADGEFHRQVAIKLVLPGLDSNEVVNRFRKERQTLAGLDHPNIVKLLDGGSTLEGLPYLVLDYVEGSPIDEYCDSHKLSIEQRLRLFAKVCEALQHAHQKLVIHRDLKPSNILVTADGIPKLLDFGIAKVLEPAARLGALTQTGARCMTPGYASPEQVRGKSVTTATDIYSLGVVLYELLTGHRPYRLKEYTASEIERAICEQEPINPSTAVMRVESEASSDGTRVSKTPEIVSQTREGQPERLRRLLRGDVDNILLKALQKEPERRYSSVEEFARDIDRHLQHQPVKARQSTFAYRVSKFVQRHKTEVSAAFAVVLVTFAVALLAFNPARMRDRRGTGSSQTKIHSLAVLPLVNISGDLTQEYFSDGLTDALIGDLAEIGSLKIISRTSSMQYKQTKKALPEIAHELDVDGIIEGTVQRSGDRVRITAQLIHGPSDKHLWANSYERDMRDMFALEREVAGSIAREVDVHLTPGQRSRLASAAPINSEAYGLYLKGRYFWNKRDTEGLKKALDYFQRTAKIEPGYAPAQAGLADTYSVLATAGYDLLPRAEAMERARAAATRAIEIDGGLADAHASLAYVNYSYDWDWAAAEKEFRRAIALNPNYATVHQWYSEYLDDLGRFEEAFTEAKTALMLDPFSLMLNENVARVHYFARRFDQAVEGSKKTLEMDSRFPISHLRLGRAYAAKAMFSEAIQEFQFFATFSGDTPLATASIANALARSGKRAGALRGLNELIVLSKHKHVPAICFALVYVGLGDRDGAINWLEKAYKERSDFLLVLNVDPLFDGLRSDPRFQDLLRRMRLPVDFAHGSDD